MWLNRLFMMIALLALLNFAACGDDDDDDNNLVDDDDDDDDDDDNDDNDNDDDNDDDDSAPAFPPPLPFSFVRDDGSEPISAEELTAFSAQMRDFLDETGFVDWLLRTSHGVDASTGLPDYRLWWGETSGEKHGGTVSIVHEYSEEHGGHNILKGNSLLLASAIGGYLRTGDPVLGELTRQFCNGISSTMLGMVHDENDPIRHLMARNVVPQNHTYLTHDGRTKFVDYSNWYHPYDRWNCSRFTYENNPYWGEVHVTNTRSKDGLGYLFKTAVSVEQAAAYAADPSVRAACEQTRSLLARFAQDIVDHRYVIRSKDQDGNAYRPGIDPEPEEADIGDLASFTAWDILMPDAECNAKQAAAFLAYGQRLGNDCGGLGGAGIYELFAIINNPPNGHIMRSFHIAAVALALHRGDNDTAQAALAGLEQRFDRDLNLDLSFVSVGPDAWRRDIAVNWLQAATAGYYLTHDEVRVIQAYALRTIEQYRQWENWDLWADTMPEGQPLDVLPPDSMTPPEGEMVYWLQPYAFVLFLDYCAGAYRNVDSPAIIDCEVLGY